MSEDKPDFMVVSPYALRMTIIAGHKDLYDRLKALYNAGFRGVALRPLRGEQGLWA